MRYRCAACGSYVKDKFIFGLLHICSEQAAEARESKILQQRQEVSGRYSNLTARQRDIDALARQLGITKNE